MIKSFHIYYLLLSLFSLFFFAQCEQESNVPPIPASFIPLSETEQYTYENEYVGEPVVVRILDVNNEPIEGSEVIFNVSEGNATLSHTQTSTDANGIAFSQVLIGDHTTEVVIQAYFAALDETIEFLYHVLPARIMHIAIVSGNQQEGLNGTQLEEQLFVKVTDDFGNEAENVVVHFEVIQGNGVLSDTFLTTNEDGLAFVDYFLATDSIQNLIVANTGSSDTIFEAMSLYPTQMSVPEKTEDHVILQWEKNINPEFKQYIVYQTWHALDYYYAKDTITDPEVTEFISTEVIPGDRYVYYVAIETNKGTIIPSDTVDIEFGDFFEFDNDIFDFELDFSRKLIYGSETNLNQIQVIDMETEEIIDKVFVGSRPKGLAISLDSSSLFIALGGSGAVAVLDLETRMVSRVIDVRAELGNPNTYDVLEALPGKLYVTCNPGRSGSGRLTKVNLNDDSVEHLNTSIRENPQLRSDGVQYLYMNDGPDLFKYDILNDVKDPVLEGSRTLQYSYQFTVDPTGDQIYLGSGKVINTSEFLELESVLLPFPLFPTFSEKEDEVYFFNFNGYSIYNTTAFEKIGQYKYSISLINKIIWNPVYANFYLLTESYGKRRVYKVK